MVKESFASFEKKRAFKILASAVNLISDWIEVR
jgi:hypothetical protein